MRCWRSSATRFRGRLCWTARIEYFAIAKAGIVGLPLNYRLAAEEVETLVASMNAAVMICRGALRRRPGQQVREDAGPRSALDGDGVEPAACVAAGRGQPWSTMSR
jgi:acyl-coenzyme A synthetase/AMP-(fatty) acid ligase